MLLAAAWGVAAPGAAQGRGTDAPPGGRDATAPASPPEVAAPAGPLSLEQALAYAERHAPSAALVTSRLGYAEAARAAERPRVPDNPSLGFGIGPRSAGRGQRDFDFVLSLGQPLEVAGERRLRLEAADRLGERLEAEADAARRALRRAVAEAHVDAVAAGQRHELASASVAFADSLLEVAQRRHAAGDVTTVEVRVAATERARAHATRLSAEAEQTRALLVLAARIGWPLEVPLAVPSAFELPEDLPTLEAALAAARDTHPTLQALRAAAAEAEARAAVAAREVAPEPVVGVQVAREGSAGSPANYIVLGTLELTLPVARRGQGERAHRAVDLEVARAEAQAMVAALEAAVRAAHAALVAASARHALFAEDVLPPLEENLALLRSGFTAGELPLLDVTVARERFLAACGEALEADAALAHARIALEHAPELGLAAIGADR